MTFQNFVSCIDKQLLIETNSPSQNNYPSFKKEDLINSETISIYEKIICINREPRKRENILFFFEKIVIATVQKTYTNH